MDAVSFFLENSDSGVQLLLGDAEHRLRTKANINIAAFVDLAAKHVCHRHGDVFAILIHSGYDATNKGLVPTHALANGSRGHTFVSKTTNNRLFFCQLRILGQRPCGAKLSCAEPVGGCRVEGRNTSCDFGLRHPGVLKLLDVGLERKAPLVRGVA